jgi:hypothetical protein
VEFFEEQRYTRDFQHLAVTATAARLPNDIPPQFGTSAIHPYKAALPYVLGVSQDDNFKAAKAVGGKAIFPIFAPGENAYPKELPPITPENYRNHLHAEKRLADAAAGKVQLSEADTAKLKESLLNDGQLAALSNMKKHTDFNIRASDCANNVLPDPVGPSNRILLFCISTSPGFAGCSIRL